MYVSGLCIITSLSTTAEHPGGTWKWRKHLKLVHYHQWRVKWKMRRLWMTVWTLGGRSDGRQEGGREGGTVGRTDSGWCPHHSLGNKPAVYGQLLICWVIIPFYPQLNQQQNKTLHKRRKAAGPTTAQNTPQRGRERDRERGRERGGEVKYARDGCI